VHRLVLVLAASSVALVVPFSSGASLERATSPTAKRTVAADHIDLKVRYALQPWKTSLYLKLVKTKLTPFEVCAIWDRPATTKWGRRCRTGTSHLLPAGTEMRLEQNPVRKALVRDDSPGWGMLGLSTEPSLGAVLSNELSGDKFGTMYYRVTLRDRATGQVLLTSNRISVVWHH